MRILVVGFSSYGCCKGTFKSKLWILGPGEEASSEMVGEAEGKVEILIKQRDGSMKREAFAPLAAPK